MMFRKGRFVYIEIDGVIKTVAGWAKEFRVCRSVIMYRYNVMGLRGMDLKVGANYVPRVL
jgi:hypothetical protein